MKASRTITEREYRCKARLHFRAYKKHGRLGKSTQQNAPQTNAVKNMKTQRKEAWEALRTHKKTRTQNSVKDMETQWKEANTPLRTHKNQTSEKQSLEIQQKNTATNSTDSQGARQKKERRRQTSPSQQKSPVFALTKVEASTKAKRTIQYIILYLCTIF